MRSLLFSLSAISLLLVPACNFRSSTSETEVAPVAPAPIPDPPPVAPDSASAQLEPAPVSPPANALTLDPAPVPPAESSSLPPEAPSTPPSSAEDVLNSVVRVLQGALEGADDETGEQSEGSVFGSIGRALSKGFQEAAANEEAAGANATDE